MAKTYQQLQAEIEALTAKAEAMRQQEIQEVVGRIKEAISFYGLTAADLGLASAGSAATCKRKPRVAAAGPARAGRGGTAGSKVAIKYRDRAGNTWTGRGNQPRWLKAAIADGAKLEDFKV